MSEAAAFEAFEREVHDRIAEGYHAAFSPVTGLAHAPLIVAAALQPGERVLDVACGPGVLSARAASLGSAVTGVDLSERMVALASRLHPALAFRVASAEALPFADVSFDAVLCAFGIGHFPEPERAGAEFARVLAPGGRLAVSWWDGPERSRINGLFFEALREERIRIPDTLPPGPDAFRFADDDALRRLFAAAGFAEPRIEARQGVHQLPDFDALWELARASFARLGTVIAGLDEAERARFRTAAAAKAAAYGDGPLAIPIAFKVASAPKAA